MPHTRREFLKGSIASTAAAVLAGLLPPEKFLEASLGRKDTLRLHHFVLEEGDARRVVAGLEGAGREGDISGFYQTLRQLRSGLQGQAGFVRGAERSLRPEFLFPRPPVGILIGSSEGRALSYGGWSLSPNLAVSVSFELEYGGVDLGPGSQRAFHTLGIAPNNIVYECYDIPDLGRAGRTYTVATLEDVPLEVIVDDWAIWSEQEIDPMTECKLGSSWVQQYVSSEELMITGGFPSGSARASLKADGEQAGELLLASEEMLLVDIRSIHELQLILQTNGRDWASNIRWSSASIFREKPPTLLDQ